ncbi:MAG: methyltransferase domain-containing protein [Terriglobia bacterium]
MPPPGDNRNSLASNEEWKAWGETDPLYGVATTPGRAKTAANAWTDETFYEVGANDWELFHRKWAQYGFNPGTCVEIGCGAGRMTVHLAKTFAHVDGVDVSPGMVEYARPRMPPNVALHVTSGLDIPLDSDSADAVFSTHVMQHLANTSAAASYLREMHRVLHPGGTVMIHLPVIAWPWGSLLGLHKLTHRLKESLDRLRARFLRMKFRRGWLAEPPMQIVWYELGWLYWTVHHAGFEDIEIRILLGGSAMALQHPFLFARKKSA